LDHFPLAESEVRQHYRIDAATRARPMYRHTDIYRPMWRCCRCIESAKFRRYILAIFAHKSVALLLCMERSETQVATSSLTMTDYHKW